MATGRASCGCDVWIFGVQDPACGCGGSYPGRGTEETELFTSLIEVSRYAVGVPVSVYLLRRRPKHAYQHPSAGSNHRKSPDLVIAPGHSLTKVWKASQLARLGHQSRIASLGGEFYCILANIALGHSHV